MHLIAETSGGMSMVFKRWATKKCAGSTKNGRDSNPKYLGVKKFGGEVNLHIVLMQTRNTLSWITSSEFALMISYCLCYICFLIMRNKWRILSNAFLLFLLESGARKYHRPPKRNPLPSWELCWHGEGPHSLLSEARTCSI
ncbi:hypothetical protein ABZP36_029643 [Zizania latifolia]